MGFSSSVYFHCCFSNYSCGCFSEVFKAILLLKWLKDLKLRLEVFGNDNNLQRYTRYCEISLATWISEKWQAEIILLLYCQRNNIYHILPYFLISAFHIWVGFFIIINRCLFISISSSIITFDSSQFHR